MNEGFCIHGIGNISQACPICHSQFNYKEAIQAWHDNGHPRKPYGTPTNSEMEVWH